jgi:iron(III) transport system permease protein
MQSIDVLPPAAGSRPRARRTIGALGWASIVVAALILVPVAALVVHATRGTGDAARHIATTLLPDYALTTFLLAAGVGVGVAVSGVVLAWLVVHYRFPGRDLLEWAAILPLAMPAYVIAYAYTDWLQFAGPVQTTLRELTGWAAREYWFPDIRSTLGAAWVFTCVLYPYVYLLVRTAFVEQSASTLEAGRVAGLGPFGSFLSIGLPLARPAIAGGVALALMETLADFGAVSYFGVQTFTTGIYRAWQSFGDLAAAAQLALVLLVFVAVVMAIERTSRGRARFQAGSVARRVRPRVLRGWHGWLAFAVCALPPVLGFLLPAVLLVRLAILDDALAIGARHLELVANSALLSIVTAVLAVALALALAYAGRLARHPGVAGANRIAALGYAVPGAVIAVGVLIPLGRLDNLIVDFMQAQFGVKVGLVFTGTIGALVYAYLVRFLAIALQSVESGLARVTPSMDDAARSLGLAPGETLLRVHAPLLRRSVLAGVLLVFVDVMKELPATFALRPFDYETLAVHVYNLAKDERLGEAAVPSLLLVAVGLVPLVILARQIGRGERVAPT